MKKAILAVIILISTALTAWLIYPHSNNILPDRVSVYLTEESRIVTLSYRDYLAGCMFASVSPSCSKEGLKAIACALNSKALYLLKTKPRSSFMGADLSDDSDICLPYLSPEESAKQFGDRYEGYRERIYESVDFGMEHVLTYNGDVICAQVCRFSTGITDSSDGLPYLASVAVPADENLQDAVSVRALSADMVMRTLSKESGVTSLPDRRELWFSDAEYLPSGTLKEICFGDKKLSGEQLRKAFGFRSAAITIEYAEQRFVFTVKGLGDNKGMSINGASVLARQGASCEEILSYFYRDTELTEL